VKLPRRYRKPLRPYVAPEPPEGLRKITVDDFTLDRPYDLLSEEHHLPGKEPGDTLGNVGISDKGI
jgi:hypothetical protein